MTGRFRSLLAGLAFAGLLGACSDAWADRPQWALRERVALVCVGAAGGKRDAARVALADLADTTHDPLLSSLRQRLRKAGVAPRQGRIGVRCVYSAEAVLRPAAVDCDLATPGAALACAGYGSSVMVTASFGLAAASEAVALHLARP